jgi:hypothetical protein
MNQVEELENTILLSGEDAKLSFEELALFSGLPVLPGP